MDTHRGSLNSEVPIEKGGAQHIEEGQYGSQENIEHLHIDEKKLLRKLYVHYSLHFAWHARNGRSTGSATGLLRSSRKGEPS